MSFTAAYSRLRKLEDGKSFNNSPRILDYEGFMDKLEELSIKNDNAVISETEDRTAYPIKKFKVFKGFKTWKPQHLLGLEHVEDRKGFYNQMEEKATKHWLEVEGGALGFEFNIERCGIPYNGPEQLAEFYGELSKFTEDFVVWHGRREHRLPNLMDLERDEYDTIYRIECMDGEVVIMEIEFEEKSEEEYYHTEM